MCALQGTPISYQLYYKPLAPSATRVIPPNSLPFFMCPSWAVPPQEFVNQNQFLTEDLIKQRPVYEDGATKVLRLINMISPDQLEDDEYYRKFCLRVTEEGQRYGGKLVRTVVPRPDPSGAPVAGVGKVHESLIQEFSQQREII
jgi:hypothetical protein